MTKLEQFIFYLFVFSIPIQSRLIIHRWTPLESAPPFNEWTAGFVYGTDVLAVLLLIVWLTHLPTLGSLHPTRVDWWLLGFLAVAGLSATQAAITGLAWYRLLKLAEFIFLYFYIRSSFGRVVNYYQLAWTMLASGLFQALVATGQYWRQGSLGLRLLGESPLSVNAANVAVIIADGVKYLRVYGTTPHPNVLAAWLLAALFAFYYLYHKQPDRRLLAVYALLLIAFFLTWSRVLIGLWGVASLIGLIRYRRQPLVKSLVISTLIVGVLFTAVFWPQVKSRLHISPDEEAVTQRIYYNQIAAQTVGQHWLLGVGIGQSVADLMSKYRHFPALFYQPVHNIYLLIASETGLLGLAAFLSFLFFNLFRKPLAIGHWLLAVLLIAGLFDHFLWTLQPGSLLLWLTLGIMAGEPAGGGR